MGSLLEENDKEKGTRKGATQDEMLRVPHKFNSLRLSEHRGKGGVVFFNNFSSGRRLPNPFKLDLIRNRLQLGISMKAREQVSDSKEREQDNGET